MPPHTPAQDVHAPGTDGTKSHASLPPAVTPQPRFLAIDEGAFRFEDKTATVVGVLTRGPRTLEAVVVDQVDVDGWNATELVVGLAQRLPGTGADRILIDGITLGGMNLVDIARVCTQLRVPVLAVARREPTKNGLERAARRAGDAEHRRALLPQHPPVEVHVGAGRLWVQAQDPDDGPLLDPARIAQFLRPAMAESVTPEPLRLAHHIATAIVRGVSGTAP